MIIKGRGTTFVDRNGWVVMPGDVTALSRRPIGEAYAMFDCKASKDKIAEVIPQIREMAETNAGLELSLIKGTAILEDKPGLLFEAHMLNLGRDSFVMRARGYGLNNEGTADELAGVVNQAYQSSLYSPREKFNRGIFYEENGRYISRD